MKLPDKIFGISTEEAYRKYLEESAKKPAEPKREPQIITPTSTTGVNLGEYLFIPPHNLYVAKQKTLHGNNWDKAHEELHKQGARMLTLREFVDLLLLLRSGNSVHDGLGNLVSGPEVQTIYDEITKVAGNWRSEWIDARFSQQPSTNALQINYRHRTINGRLQPQTTESLEQCIMDNKTPGISLDDWLKGANRQGLPAISVRDGALYYVPPKDGKVVGFYASSLWADLFCDGDPSYSDASLGVRAARDKT